MDNTKCTIKPITVAEILDDSRFRLLAREYAAESRPSGMPPAKVDFAVYAAMVESGTLKAFGAYADDDLVGFISVLIGPSFHYSAQLAVIESFYVLNAHRRFGTAFRLMQSAEDWAKEMGCTVMIATAPIDGRMAAALPILGFEKSHYLCFRRLEP